MKIIGLQSQNIKRLKAIELDLDDKGNLIIISGKNAQGKTSLLDSIWMALGGTKAIPAKPIRDGEESAEITLKIKGDKLSFVVKRTFTDKGTYLVITNESGDKYTNPQEMLNHIIGNLSFDPLEFTRFTNKEQVQQLMKLTGLDFDEVDKKVKDLRLERTTIGRVGKTFKKIDDDKIELFKKEAEKEELSISELSNSYQSMLINKKDYQESRERIIEINTQLKNLTEEREKLEAIEIPAGNPDELKIRIDNADSINKKIRESKLLVENHIKAIENKNEYDNITKEITEIEEGKKKSLTEAKMPVDNLEWDEDGVRYGNIPFNQLSGSEQLRVSMAIAMDSNPHMRVILIKDGSLLDKDSLNIVESMAKEKDYQIWMECVDDSGKVGIYIEDGEIKKPKK